MNTYSHFAVIRTIGRSRQSMTAPVTPEYASAAHAHAAPLVDQEYLRKDDQAKHGEEHDDQHKRHVGTLLENAGVCPASTGAGSSARAHARGGSASDNPRQSYSRLNQRYWGDLQTLAIRYKNTFQRFKVEDVRK